jgi:hypothetical protein
VLILLLVASLPVLAHLLYRVWIAFTLEYWVDRNAITLRWANVHQVIPLAGVMRIVRGREMVLDSPALWAWPAPFVRPGPAAGGRPLIFCASLPPAECTFLETPQGVFALSPSAPEAFIHALQERYQMGPALSVTPGRVRKSWLDRVLLADRLGVTMLGVGLLGVLVLFGVLMISFPDLPEVLTVRYNSLGLPVEIREKSALFRLPFIGLLAWVINGAIGLWLLARQQPTGAYMLWGGAILVEIFSLFALVSLIA